MEMKRVLNLIELFFSYYNDFNYPIKCRIKCATPAETRQPQREHRLCRLGRFCSHDGSQLPTPSVACTQTLFCCVCPAFGGASGW